MPLRRHLPTGARVWVQGPQVTEVVQVSNQAGPKPPTDAHGPLQNIEHLFHQWAAVAEGRPLSQAGFPADPAFGAALLILREWRHHVGVEAFEVQDSATHNPGP
jgi:hypothetical protein